MYIYQLTLPVYKTSFYKAKFYILYQPWATKAEYSACWLRVDRQEILSQTFYCSIQEQSLKI